MLNILQNGYLSFTGNIAFDFFFSWVGFFVTSAWSISLVIKIISKFVR